MRKRNLAFIDLETTGLDPDRHEIIEVGGIIVRQSVGPNGERLFEVIEEFEYKVKPEHLETAEPEALRINGYNDLEWLFAAELKAVMQIIADKTMDCVMVGQNVFFDWSFLKEAFAKTGVVNRMHFQRLDLISMVFAKHHDDEALERFNLGALAKYFGVENEKAHSALADIRATFEIYKKLLKR